MSSRKIGLILCGSLLAVAVATSAHAQNAVVAPATTSADDDVGIQDIVVTAQKRSETANKVGMSITALSGDTLVRQGVVSIGDLSKVVPGFVATDSARGTPIYSIRGIGFDDSTLGSNSTVALYVDEVPLTFPVESRFATLDLERVEVLKGPQGILFGQNATAGAINFISAKPTDSWKVGADGSFGSFSTVDLRAFAGGPITDRLGVRISAMTVQSGGWQKSYTRDDKLGSKRQFAGRIITQWQPLDALKISLNVNGWVDHSDTQAAQLFEANPEQKPFVDPLYDAYPRSPRNNRAADWDPLKSLKRDDNFLQASARADYSVTDSVTITSISAWSRYNQDFTQDSDGSALNDFTLRPVGHIRSFNQELRIAGDLDSIKWIFGGNYSRDHALDGIFYDITDGSPGRGFNIHDLYSFSDQHIRTLAAFGNVDISLGETVKLHGGLRYTDDRRTYEGCTADPGTDGSFKNFYNAAFGFAGTPNEIGLGGCVTQAAGVPGVVPGRLHENNLSWRAGIDFQIDPAVLLYANIGKGYKAGSFPNTNAASSLQLSPVKQESVLAYEAGLKAGFLDRKVQLNAAAFYYDYGNKQLRGRVLDPLGIFGVLDKLLNVPKSRIIGAEANLQVAPTRGLNLNVSATYVDSKVTGNYFAYDPVGNLFNYSGLAFPHTPKWNLNASVDYEVDISSEMGAFAGANYSYQSSTTGLFADKALVGLVQPSPVLRPGVFLDPDTFDVKAYSTVDARLGVQDANRRWKAWIWGRNIFNTYHFSNVTQALDAIYRLAGQPRTLGVSASLRY